jgi:hypothetical protein
MANRLQRPQAPTNSGKIAPPLSFASIKQSAKSKALITADQCASSEFILADAGIRLFGHSPKFLPNETDRRD